MSEWQPIETAPKDGTPIIGYFGGKMAVVEWDGYWSLSVPGDYAEDDEWWPTHWLPAPPNSTTQSPA